MSSPDYHKLLRRQIGKYLDPAKVYPPEIDAFISAIDDSYKHYETDRELIERAMMISSEELESLLSDVRAKSELQKKILQQLKTLLDDPSGSTFNQTDDDLELLVQQLQKELDEKIIAHKALHESEHNLKALIENTDDIILSIDTHYQIITFNSHFSKLDLFNQRTFPRKGVSIFDVISEGIAKEWKSYFDSSFKTEKYKKEVKYRLNDDDYYFELSFNSIIQDNVTIGTTLFIRDITDRVGQTVVIEKALEEKKVLLKEIHHRVKNNLQVITSLLNLQAKRIPDLTTRDLFKTSQHRINSIAIIHEMLYSSEDIRRINFKEYIQNLVHTLIQSFKGIDNKIVFELDIEDTHLVMDLAIPLGLIVNEIVTNSLKYGIKEEGVLSIQLTNRSGLFKMHLRDDGPGMNLKNTTDTKKLGLKMVDYLIQQIEGTYEIIPESTGSHIKLTFSNELNKTDAL